MDATPPSSPEPHELEGDYRPANPATPGAHLDPMNIRVEPADVTYLMQLAETLNTTLDLETLLRRTSDLVRAVIPYRIFAILLLNDRTHELRVRFQIGHTAHIERLRIPMGKGVVGQVALTRQPVLLNDVTTSESYVEVNPDVRSELAVPLIAKNRLIGVMDIESEQADYFRPEHLRLLTLTASRIAQAIENARLYARVSRQAQTLAVLNEIATELISILDLNPLLERVGQLLRRLIDYQMFSILLLDEKGEKLITRYSWRFGSAEAPMRSIPISSGLVGAAVREWRLINVHDVRKDQRYVPLNPETRSELIAPLFHKGRIIGVLDLEHTRANFFNEEHERTRLSAVRNGNWNGTSPWPAKFSSACCRPLRRRWTTPIWRCAFCPPAAWAATFTTLWTTAPAGPLLFWATSAARPLQQHCLRPWSAASCAPPRNCARSLPNCLPRSTTRSRSASSNRSM
jgi:sigma-B regulation protein RsbU (phosphoserine phosphatase)